ncbi:MAG TPA: rhodanese-like domain-containing protein [Terriglobales bacterium]
MKSNLALTLVICGVLLLTFSPALRAQWNQPQPATTLKASALIQPAELAQTLRSGKNKPLIFNVGPRMLYVQAHIPGAEFIGPGSDPDTITRLTTRVASLPKKSAIVLYCGCCPWDRCPNVAPAYTALQKLGFTNVKVLYIADNLGADWVYKGYPSASGNQ